MIDDCMSKIEGIEMFRTEVVVKGYGGKSLYLRIPAAIREEFDIKKNSVLNVSVLRSEDGWLLMAKK